MLKIILLVTCFSILNASKLDNIINKYEDFLNIKLLDMNKNIESQLHIKYFKLHDKLSNEMVPAICLKVKNFDQVFYVSLHTTILSSYHNTTQLWIYKNNPFQNVVCKNIRINKKLKIYLNFTKKDILNGYRNSPNYKISQSDRRAFYDESISMGNSKLVKYNEQEISQLHLSKHKDIDWFLYKSIGFNFKNNKVKSYSIIKTVEGNRKKTKKGISKK